MSFRGTLPCAPPGEEGLTRRRNLGSVWLFLQVAPLSQLGPPASLSLAPLDGGPAECGNAPFVASLALLAVSAPTVRHHWTWLATIDRLEAKLAPQQIPGPHTTEQQGRRASTAETRRGQSRAVAPLVSPSAAAVFAFSACRRARPRLHVSTAGQAGWLCCAHGGEPGGIATTSAAPARIRRSPKSISQVLGESSGAQSCILLQRTSAAGLT